MNTIKHAIDAAYAREQTSGFRYHLGASVIGRECAREIWYKFRWWKSATFSGRMLRLFQRGHREEASIVENLRKIGAVVKDVDEHGKQTRFSTLGGLFGGERDAAISNMEPFGLKGEGIAEFKTHSLKSFNQLAPKGVAAAKPEHFVQMQLYMSWSGLSWALYYAVCKDNDDIYIEIVHAKPEVADQYTTRAKKILSADAPPKRLSQDPTFYKCKFCDFNNECHQAALPEKNCRTCANVELLYDDDSHSWYCHKWRADIPQEYSYAGCDNWSPK